MWLKAHEKGRKCRTRDKRVMGVLQRESETECRGVWSVTRTSNKKKVAYDESEWEQRESNVGGVK